MGVPTLENIGTVHWVCGIGFEGVSGHLFALPLHH